MAWGPLCRVLSLRGDLPCAVALQPARLSRDFPRGVAGCGDPFPKETAFGDGGKLWVERKKERNPIRLSKPSTVLFPSGQACEVPAKLCILGQMRNTCHPRSPVTKERCRRCVPGPALGAGCCCLVALRHGLGIEGCSAWRVPGCDPRCWHLALGTAVGVKKDGGFRDLDGREQRQRGRCGRGHLGQEPRKGSQQPRVRCRRVFARAEQLKQAAGSWCRGELITPVWPRGTWAVWGHGAPHEGTRLSPVQKVTSARAPPAALLPAAASQPQPRAVLLQVNFSIISTF